MSAELSTAPVLLTPREMGAVCKVTSAQVLQWHHAGVIPAEIAEGRVYRFDAAKVAKALAKRASKPAATTTEETPSHLPLL